MNKRGWVIYPAYTLYNKNHAFDWICGEASACGIDLEVIFFEELFITTDGRCFHRGEEKELPDFILMRGYETLLSNYFELKGVPVFNTTKSMVCSRNKMLTHQILCSKGISTVKTFYLNGGAYPYDGICELLGSSLFVVKQIEGSKGENVHLIGSEEELFDALDIEGPNCVVQEYIATSHGRDLRVWVVGNEAVAAVLRYSDCDFRSNFSQGGCVAAYELTPEIAKLAVDASQALGLDFAGVDLLFTEDGFIVCEVNGNAGFRSLSALGASVNLPSLLFRHIRRKIG